MKRNGNYVVKPTGTRFLAVLASLFVLVSGCDYKLDADNPFDPESPPDKQAKGSLSGTVDLQYQGAEAQDAVTITLDGEGQTLTTTSREDGAYSFEESVMPGSWMLRYTLPTYQETTFGPFEIGAAESMTIPVITLLKRVSALNGSVTLDGLDENGQPIEDFSGVRLVLRSKDAVSGAESGEDAPRSYTTVSDSDGSYYLGEVPFGSYELIAGLDGFSSSLSPVTVEDDEMILNSIRLVSSMGAVRIADGAEFSSNREVSVLLRASGPIKSWTLSEDADFADGTTISGEIPDTTETLFVEETFTLSEGDGEKIVFGRYETFAGAESDIASDGIVLDTTPPANAAVIIAGNATYATNAVVELTFQAGDLLSGVKGMRVSTDGLLDEETVVDFALNQTVTLPIPDTGDGVELSVRASFIDGAGNESDPVKDTILFDNTPPAVGTQAVRINGGDAATPEAAVTLEFDITGASHMMLSNDSGLGGASWMPFASTFAGWRLAEPELDGNKTVYARFRDEAGNETDTLEDSIAIDSTGILAGTLALVPADTPNPFQNVEFALDGQKVGDGFGSVSLDLEDGSFELGDIPYGTYGGLRVTKADFAAAQTGALVVKPGETRPVGELTLSSLYGRTTGRLAVIPSNTPDAFDGIAFTLDGQAVGAENVTVEENGAFVLSRLAVGVYATLKASKNGFSAGTNGMIQITAGAPADAGTLTLSSLTSSVTGSLAVVPASTPEPFANVSFRLNGQAVPAERVTIEENGDFSIADVPVGIYSGLTALKPDFHSARSEALSVEAAGPAVAGELTLIDTVGAISGTVAVVPADTPDALLGLSFSLDGELVEDANLDTETGTFLIENLPTGAYGSLIVSKANFSSGQALSILVNPGVTHDAGTLTLTDKFGGVTGTLVIENDADPTDVELLVGGAAAPQAVIQENGHFTIPGLAVGAYPYVAARKSGYSEGRSEYFAVEPGRNADIGIIRLDRARGAIEGWAKLVGRSDHAGILVRLSGTSHTGVTDATGYFYMGDIVVGTYELVASKDGFVQRTLGGAGVEEDQVTTLNAVDNPLLLSPQEGDFRIEGGAAYTNQTVVTLELEYEEAAAVRVSEDDDFFNDPGILDPPFVDLSTLVDEGVVTLDGDVILYTYEFAEDPGEATIVDGQKTIYVQFQDVYGQSSETFSGSIILDRLPPELIEPPLTINGGDAYTNNPSGLVSLGFSVYDENGVEFVYLSRDDATYQPRSYVPAVSYPLSAPETDGQKHVYVYFVDVAGNRTETVHETIVLDTEDPEFVSFAIEAETTDGSTKYTTSPSVTLRIEAVGASQMMVSNYPSFVGSSWEPYATSRVWSLPVQETEHLVTIKFRDEAGNLLGADASINDSIVLDTTAPPAPEFLLAGSGVFQQYSRRRDIQLEFQNAPAGVKAQVADDLSFPSPAFDLPVGGVVDHDLDDYDGLQLVVSRYLDVAGNASAPVQKPITLDRVAPYGEQIAVSEGSVVNDPTVTLLLSAIGATEMAVHESADCAGSDWEPYRTAKSVTAVGGDGQKTFSVKFRDSARNESGCAAISFSLDETDPQVSLRINEGDAYSQSRGVTLSVDASDSDAGTWGGIEAMRVTNSAPFTDESWEPLQNSKSWMLSLGSGEKSVWVQVRDRSGRIAQAQDDIILDTEAPSVSVSITDDDGYTQSRTVSLTITASDDIAEAAELAYYISNSPTFPAAQGQPFAYVDGGVTRDWDLSEGDGLKNVYVRMVDLAGNITEAWDSTILDVSGPAGSNAYVQEGEYLNDPACTLVAYSSGADEMRIEGDVTDTSYTFRWIALAGSTPLVLNDVDQGACRDTGDCTVRVTFRDNAGHTDGPVMIALVLDTDLPTGTLTINDGDTHTDSPAVTLSLDVADATTEVASMRINNVNDFAGRNWEVFVSSRAWVLPSNNDSHAVYAQIRDAAGNVRLLTDGIILDDQPPALTAFSIENDAAYTATRDVSIFVNAGDAGSAVTDLTVKLSNDPSFNGAVSYVMTGAGLTVDPWTLSEGDGTKNVYLRIEDEAGNRVEATESIFLDTETPTVSLQILGDDPRAQNTTTLNLSASADTQYMWIQTTDSIDCSGEIDTPYQSQITGWPLGDSSGTITVSACFKDRAGNVSQASDSVLLDLDNPGGTLSINEGGTLTGERVVTLTISNPTDATTRIESMRVTNSTFAGEPFEPFASTRTWILSALNGTRTVTVELMDSVGNTASIQDDIVLDTIAPVGLSIRIDLGASYTQDAEVSLEVNGSDALTEKANLRYYLSNSPSFADAVAQSFDPGAGPTTTAWTLEEGNGMKTVYLVVADEADNTAHASDSIFLDAEDPYATLTIDADSPTNDRTVDLLFSAASDVEQFAVANGGSIDCETATYQEYDPDSPVLSNHDLGAVSGKITVWGCFKDASGRTVAVSDSIRLDLDAPNDATVSILGNDPANTPTVNLHLTAPDDVTMMAVGDETLNCDTATYEAFNPYPTRTFASVTGLKRVRVCFRDQAGNHAWASDTVYLDVTPPAGGVSINETGPVNDPNVHLKLTPELPVDGNTVSHIRVVNRAEPVCDIGTAGWVAYENDSPAWTLDIPAGGDGQSYVSVCFRDQAGNTSSATASIRIDTLPPSGTVALDREYYNGPGDPVPATLSLTRSSSEAAWRSVVVNTTGVAPDCADAALSWEAYADTKAVVLDADALAETGIVNSVFLCLKDTAGNVSSAPATDSAVVDTNAPEGSVNILGDDPTNESTVIVRLHDASSDTIQVAVANEIIDCALAEYQTYTEGMMFTWTLAVVQGSRTVAVCFKDRAGNTFETSDSVVLDTEAPYPGILTVGGGQDLIATTSVDVNISGGNANLDVILVGDILPTDQGRYAYTEFPLSDITLTHANGLNTVTAYFEDEAGNRSVGFSDVVQVDTQRPELGDIKINGASWEVGDAPIPVDAAALVVEIFPADADAAYFEISEDLIDLLSCDPGADGCAAIAPSRVFSVSSTLGVKILHFRFFDKAGNASLDAGQFQVELVSPQVVRPVPEMERISPRSIIALQSDEYRVMAIGTKFATDSVLRIGDFELSAACTGIQGGPAGVTCTDANLEGTTCDGDPNCRNCCQATINTSSPAWALVQNAGSYLVRVVTPEPVTGTGVSLDTDFLYVVAPPPEILDFTRLDYPTPSCTEGIVDSCDIPERHKRYQMGLDNPPSEFTMVIWGRKLMGNVDVRIENVFGRVTYVGADPDAPSWDPNRQIAVAEISGLHLPPSEPPFAITLINPTPGGGEDSMPFGSNYLAREAGSNVSSIIRENDLVTYEIDQFAEWFDNPANSINSPLLLELSSVFWLGSGDRSLSFGAWDHHGDMLYQLRPGQFGSGTPLGMEAWTIGIQSRPGRFQYDFDPGFRTRPTAVFGHSDTVTVGNSPSRVAVGYLGHELTDGNPQIVTSNEDSYTITVAWSSDAGFFGWDVGNTDTYNVLTRPMESVLVDVNRDGHLDIATCHRWTSSEGALTILMNKGDGTFENQVIYEAGNDAENIAAGDLNNDSFPDIVLADRSGNWIYTLLNKGDGTFLDAERAIASTSPMGVELADFDLDGNLDIVASSNSLDMIRIIPGYGDGTFSTATAYQISVINEPHELAVDDFNADGIPDIVVVGDYYNQGDNDNNADVLIGKGDFAFETPVTYDLPERATSHSPNDVDTGDLNNDGYPEIVIGYSSYHYITILWNNGDGSFTMQEHDTGHGVNGVCLADLTNEGHLDLVTTSSNYGEFYVHDNLGEGTYYEPLTTLDSSEIYHPTDPQLADLNRDGEADLIAVHENRNYVEVFLGSGGGAFGAGATYVTHTGSAYSSLAYPNHVVVSDFDGDGEADVAASNSSSYYLNPNDVAVLFGNGTGALTGLTRYGTGAKPMDLVAADFNDDGAPDIATANNTTDTLSVLLNNGDGTFAAKVDYSFSSSPQYEHEPTSIHAGDFNGDGVLDLVVGHWMYHVSVLLGEKDGNGAPTGTFGASQYIPTTTNGAGGLRVADLNLDGADDIVSGTHNGPAKVQILLNDRNGDFTSNAVDSSQYGEDLALTDFDGDGFPDILVTDENNGYANILMGLGDGDFRDYVRYKTGNAPRGLTTADITGDGVVDMIVANSTDNTFSIFTPPVNTTAIRQDLRYSEVDELLATNLDVASGNTKEFSVHQATQDIQNMTVELYLTFESQPLSGDVKTRLTAPNGDFVELGTHDVSEVTGWPTDDPTAWRLIVTYPASTFSDLLDVQPTGDWTMQVVNETDAKARLKNLVVHTMGRLYGPQPGDRADRAENLTPGDFNWTGRVVLGSTLGYSKKEELSCIGSGDMPDRYYEFTLEEDNTLNALSVVGAFDSAVEIRSGSCGDVVYTVKGCDYNSFWGPNARLENIFMDAGTYCIIVDGRKDAGKTNQGEFWMYIRFQDPVLGP